jgi:multidrug transporter EmrE-like cation transporter
MGIIFLALTILTEVAGTINLKYAEGLAHTKPFLAAMAFYIANTVFLSYALK